MNVWMHKVTGDVCVAIEVAAKHVRFMEEEFRNPYQLTGNLNCEYYQPLGYAIQNGNGITAVFPFSVRNEFEDLGEL